MKTASEFSFLLLLCFMVVPTTVRSATLIARWEFEGNYRTSNGNADYYLTPGGGGTIVNSERGQVAEFHGGTFLITDAATLSHPDLDRLDTTAKPANASFNGGLSIMGWVMSRSEVSPWEDADVVLIGTNGIVLVADTGSNPDSNWSRRSISLTESAGWRIVLLSGEVPTKSEFLAVLTGLSAVRIRGEFKSESDVGYLDNVAMEAGTHTLTIRVSQVEICWNSRLGRLYQVQWSTEIQPAIWFELGTPIPGTGARFCAHDPVTAGQPRRFYRVLELP